jgi:hypothetical protein
LDCTFYRAFLVSGMQMMLQFQKPACLIKISSTTTVC